MVSEESGKTGVEATCGGFSIAWQNAKTVEVSKSSIQKVVIKFRGLGVRVKGLQERIV